MKVSLICTVKNEESTIEELLESIIAQTKPPDEVIIVDGGSTDNTLKILRRYKEKLSNLRIIEKPGANIAQGRNIAIKAARNEIIASTDAGCVLDKRWLEEITKPFKEGADVVAGGYRPLAKNEFEYFQGLVVAPSLERIFKSVARMSSRSIAFKKECWEKAGGYPEDTYTGEDTLFNLRMREKGCRFAFAPNAIVFWRMRPSWSAFAKQFYLYGLGDGRTRNVFKMKANLALVAGFMAYMASVLGTFLINSLYSILLLLIPVIYSLLCGVTYFAKTKKPSALYYIPLLILVKRISYIAGVYRGLIG